MIQIIEDDLVTSHIITALMQRMRFSYCEAATGADAIEQLKTKPIDLVVLDMMLPDMHGLALLEFKHGQRFLRDIPVICCTAQADIDTVEAAMGFGAVDFIKKPLAVQALAGRVTRAMERAPARWEPWQATTNRLRYRSFTIHPMLPIAQQVLRELDDALAEAQVGTLPIEALAAVVARARGAALNVGALRTAQQLDTLWSGSGSTDDIAELRAALVIELASFDDEILVRAEQSDIQRELKTGHEQQVRIAVAARDPMGDSVIGAA